MVIRYLFTLLLTLILIIPANPQEVKKTGGFARISGMGNNPYIVDPYFMTVNPAWAAYYDDFLFGDLGASSLGNTAVDFRSGGVGQFVAANFGLGSNFTLGAFLTRDDFSGFSIAAIDPLSRAGFGVVNILNNLPTTGLAAVGLNNNVELMASLQMGRMALGFGIAYASTTREENRAGTIQQTGGTTEASASQIGLNGGLLVNFTNTLRLDAGVSLILPSASYTPPDGPESSVSETVLLINARLFSRFSSKVTLVPSFSFITASGSTEEGFVGPDTTRSTDLSSITAFTIGLGANYEVGDFLLAGGLSLASASITAPSSPGVPELSNSLFVFPIWNLGLEWNMTDWFVARIGYIATTIKQTNESNAPQTPSTSDVNESITTLFSGPNGATVGVGFRLGDFSLDATVNEGVLRQGLNNIGGGGPTFAYLSVSYALP